MFRQKGTPGQPRRPGCAQPSRSNSEGASVHIRGSEKGSGKVQEFVCISKKVFLQELGTEPSCKRKRPESRKWPVGL